MLAEELINQMIPPLKLTDIGSKALSWMDVFRLSQLPVVDGKRFMGLITEDAIWEKNDDGLPIQEYRIEYKDLAVLSTAHYYDVINIASKYKVEIIPVVNNANEFLGVISVDETSSAIAQMFASQSPGGIIVLHMKDIDYSLAEIARLVESNDTKILSVFVHNDDKNAGYIKVTLKLNRVELKHVIATLERYEYRIIAHFQEVENENYDQDRLDMLFKYLNI
jgi:Mg/Co/Ni transporter MgtE